MLVNNNDGDDGGRCVTLFILIIELKYRYPPSSSSSSVGYTKRNGYIRFHGPFISFVNTRVVSLYLLSSRWLFDVNQPLMIDNLNFSFIIIRLLHAPRHSVHLNNNRKNFNFILSMNSIN